MPDLVITTIGFDVYAEADGRGVHAEARDRIVAEMRAERREEEGGE